MKKYRIEFIGREVNALGITYPITAEREAENEDAAVLKLYDKYDHIRVVKITELRSDQ